MADFLEDKKREINARLKELRPLVDEYTRLQAAAQALDGVTANGTSPPDPPRTPRGPPPTHHARPPDGHRRRPSRPAEGQRHPLQAGTGPGPREARDHDSRA